MVSLGLRKSLLYLYFNSEKSSGGENPEAVPLANNTMAYLGANQYSASHALTLVPLHRFIVTILAFSVLALSWLFWSSSEIRNDGSKSRDSFNMREGDQSCLEEFISL